VSVRGAIDRCTERTLAGWIRNDADPDRPIRMQICADGRAIAELIVSGDGHAFTYAAPNGVDLTRQRLSLAFPDGEIEPIEIEAWRCPIVIPAVPPAVLQQQASRQLGRMFHSIDLGGGHWTDGLKSPDRMRFEAQAWEFPADLRGKSVLDIGCADGGWSVEAYRRGARQVLSIDERTTGAMRFFLDNRVFPFDSDTTRTPHVPTRANSPSDVAFLSRDSANNTLSYQFSVPNANVPALTAVEPE